MSQELDFTPFEEANDKKIWLCGQAILIQASQELDFTPLKEANDKKIWLCGQAILIQVCQELDFTPLEEANDKKIWLCGQAISIQVSQELDFTPLEEANVWAISIDPLISILWGPHDLSLNYQNRDACFCCLTGVYVYVLFHQL